MAWDLDEYRREAEIFLEEIDREYYLQGAGHKPDLADRTDLREARWRSSSGSAVERVGEARRSRGRRQSDPFGDDEEEARLRYLHQFALDGHLGAITRDLEARRPISRHRSRSRWAARRSRTGWRRWSRRTSRTPNAGPRSRRRATRSSRSGSIRCISRGSRGPTPACTALGWPSYLDAYSDVRALDLRALAAAARVTSWRPRRPATPAPSIRSWRERSGAGWASCGGRTSPVSFVPPTWTRSSRPKRWSRPSATRWPGSGSTWTAQSNVTLDTEARPTKSPRAFCSTPRVPEEVYLVLPPIGGREDYAALFHEAGHAEHYGCTDAELAFEFRHLGDNGVTESFAFLLEGLTANGEWLAALPRESRRRRRRSSMRGRPGW